MDKHISAEALKRDLIDNRGFYPALRLRRKEGTGMNCLFKVRRKSTGEIVSVYGVKSERFVEFLIYSRYMGDGSNGEWCYVPAYRFVPIEEGGAQE